MSNPEVTCSSRLHHNFIPSLNLDGNSGACVVAVNDIIVTLESINHLRLQTSELKVIRHLTTMDTEGTLH